MSVAPHKYDEVYAMNNLRYGIRFGLPPLVVVALALTSGGCGPSYRELRVQGQKCMRDGAYGPARSLFLQADEIKPRRVANLHDLGACSVMLARDKFSQTNYTAAEREVDRAITYYTRAIDAHPGHQASLEGKRIALRLKGQFDEALEHAQWAAEFVGPSAQQYMLLAEELEERGDDDAALLRYRQAVAMEPDNAEAHVAFAEFLIQYGNEDAAVHHLQRAYRIDPRNTRVVDELVKRGALPPLTAPQERTPQP